MKKIFFTIQFLLISFFLTAGDDISLLRYPDISPDATFVVFSYKGDIWKAPAAGGRSERLTDHIGDDTRPKFSPDGKMIAFSSDRNGNYDVFVIPAEGGYAKQLTYRSSPDVVTGWAGDGKDVIFPVKFVQIFIDNKFPVHRNRRISHLITFMRGQLYFIAPICIHLPEVESIILIRYIIYSSGTGYRPFVISLMAGQFHISVLLKIIAPDIIICRASIPLPEIRDSVYVKE